MQPLKGVTVLDISRLLPGGYASLLLRDLGARIIKVEQPGVGDYYRVAIHNKSLISEGHVEAISEGKESLGLDLKSDEGREIFKKLVFRSDVVLESFRPGVLKKLKIDYKVLKKINSKIILCSITGFGQKGTHHDLAGHDINYLGLSGLLTHIRDQNGEVVLPGFQIVDLVAGENAVRKITAALFEREKKKKGCWIDCSMLEAGMSLSRLYPVSWKRGRSPVAGGLIRYGVYETKDRQLVSLGALEPKFWLKFCSVIDRPEWADGAEKFKDLGKKKREELKKIFRSKTAPEWVALGVHHDLCLFPVREAEGLGFSPKKIPSVGQKTGKILKKLGFNKSELEALTKKGVVQ